MSQLHYYGFPYTTPPPPNPTPKLSPPTPSPPPPSSSPPPPPPQFVPPPPSPPAPHHTTIIVVCVSLGGLFLLACLAAALCCWLKKRKKRTTQETDVVNVEDNVHVHETVVTGPQGQEMIALSIDEDVKVQEVIKKNEVVAEGSRAVLAMETPMSEPLDEKHHHASS